MKDIQIVFSDIDGTIFHENSLIPSAVEAIESLQKHGIHVALCTGRSVLHTQSIQDLLKIPYGVYFNGGLAKYRENAIHSTPIDADVVNRIQEFTDEHNLPVIFHTDEKAYIHKPMPSEYMPLLHAYDYPDLELIDKETFSEYVNDVYQANVMMDRSWDQLVQNKIPECLIYRWDEKAVDLQKRGCDKSQGAVALLDHLNLSPEQAIHIGDGGNDIGMFEMMKIGIAMGNAPDDVKARAQRETQSVTSDGFYCALKELGLI